MATRIKTVSVKAGEYMRVHIFPVRNVHRGKRTARFKPSSAAQEKYNGKMASLHFIDLLHANFTGEDYAVRLSYAGESPDAEESKRALANFIRRLKYAYGKRGVVLKALWTTHRGKNGGRIHHHLAINNCPGVTDNQRQMKRIWANGGRGGESFVYIAPLEFDTESGSMEDGGLVGIGKYYIFDNDPEKERMTFQVYGRTRNLAEPEIREAIGLLTQKEAAYINERQDASVLEELYEGYTVRTVAPEIYDEDGENARFCTGLFTTVWLSTKKGGGVHR